MRLRMRRDLPAAVLLPITLLLIGGCQAGWAQSGRYAYHPPTQVDDGWQTASLEHVGMDTGRMIAFMNALAGHPDHWVHSVVVVKDGKLVFEEYFPGRDLDLSHLDSGLAFAPRAFDRNTLHSVASVSKSVTAILLGIAIDAGLVAGTQETMFSYFPDYARYSDASKRQITLEHMLAMTSGLPWTEAYAYDDPRNDLVSMVFADDPIGYVLSKPTAAVPGTRFMYNSGTANLVGEIIRRTSGMTLAAFAEQYLFAPLGIDAYAWYPFPHAPEMTVASSTLYLRPRDMAKIGQMYLDGGVWNGTRVVSERWVTQSTQQTIAMGPSDSPVPGLNPSYGLLWWRGTFAAGKTDTYFAAGHGGEFIFVFPESRMVVVFTAGNFDGPRNYDPLLQIVNQYVLPSVQRR